VDSARSDHWIPLQSFDTELNDRSTLVCAVASEAHAIRHAVDTIVIVTVLILMGSDS
jgi:hypothetical protein